MDAAAIRTHATTLPTDPGVYQFCTDTTPLYIGKATNLRERVRAYTDPRSPRIQQMVDRAETIDVTVTATPTQALLLEANLITQHQPAYNARLTDDTTYPFIHVTEHTVPRLTITRDPPPVLTETTNPDRVFGPYTNPTRVETVVKALRDIYGVRGCSDHKYQTRDRPCLDYDIGLCTAPCVDHIDHDSYLADVDAVIQYLQGDTSVLTEPLRREMQRAAAAHEFERAANLRDKLAAATTLHGDTAPAVTTAADTAETHVFGIARTGTTASVTWFRSTNGQLVDRDHFQLTLPTTSTHTSLADSLSTVLTQFYARHDLPATVVVPEHPTDDTVTTWLEQEGVTLRVPTAGREATLVDLAVQNAQRTARTDTHDELAALADALDLETVPRRIEGVDVSHTQGDAVVGSNVVFVDGDPKPDAYRRRTLPDTNDDYAMIRELVSWRAERARAGRDTRPDPDLLVVDGGRGQLTAARTAVETHDWERPVIALAKADEQVLTPTATHNWPADAPHLHVIQRVRDEAHRFAVQYHQQLRDEVTTALDAIDGVGPTLRQRLLRRFGSVAGVRNASHTELQAVAGVGSELATVIQAALTDSTGES